MKVSVSLPDDDVEFLDDYATRSGVGSRSAALQAAVRLLRASQLRVAYEQAWDEWESTDDAALWDSSVGDR